MTFDDSQSRRPGRRVPLSVERLESRDLPSVAAIYYRAVHLGYLNHRSLAVHSLANLGAGTGSGGGASGIGQPTPHELARERFIAKESGPYVTGPGRFTNQALQVFILGTGYSNQSRNMNLQLRYFIPADPAQPTTGVAAFVARNVASTGNTLILDLTGAPQVGSHGLPSHFTWTVDPSSGGIWLNAAGFGTGQGTLDIHYAPGGQVPPNARSAGRAFVVAQGEINAAGMFNSIFTLGNIPKQP